MIPEELLEGYREVMNFESFSFGVMEWKVLLPLQDS
jgi:hypothetical protein